MVTDAYSADGGRQPSEDLIGNPQGIPSRHPRPPANLTQELAQLLAASIAQGQTGQRAGTPTGAELASLAALVSASQNQRAIRPIVQGWPVLPFLFAATETASTKSGVQLTEHHDDEPMPIPSTWRQPTVNNDDRWYRQQMGAAVLGLVAGLMVVVPAVLWLSGWLGGPQTRVASVAGQLRRHDVDPSDVKTVKVQVRPVEKTEVASQYVAATVEPASLLWNPPPPAPPPVVEAPVPVPAPSQGRAAAAEGRRPAGAGRAAHREAATSGRTRDARRQRKRRSRANHVRAGGDLRSQHAGSLGHPRHCRRRHQGQIALLQGARSRRDPGSGAPRPAEITAQVQAGLP